MTLSETALKAYQEELFRVQCRILDLGTRTTMNKLELQQELLLLLRHEIIEFRSKQVV